MNRVAWWTTVIATSGRAAAVSPSASPTSSRTIRLGWAETREYSSPHMTFHVAWVRIMGDRWTVRASFTNKGTSALLVTPQQWAAGTFSPHYGFAIVSPGSEHESVGAKTSTPTIPARIKPGATWSGTFGGTGATRLPRGTKLSISFGYFIVASVGNGFSWLTQHSFR